MAQDEIIKEVRAIREAYGARFGFDIRAIYNEAKQSEGKSGRPVIAPEPRRTRVRKSATPLPDLPVR
jgi:hypothetical protein